jgi:hypothetical protein
MPWKASALKKAVGAACLGSPHPFFECGLGRGFAVRMFGRVRDDMSGPNGWTYFS